MKLARIVDHVASGMAEFVWRAGRTIDRRWPGASAIPTWGHAPVPKPEERTHPQLGWPRETDSLCPGCIRELRAAIDAGTIGRAELAASDQGAVRASIVERDGRLWMDKTCDRHGATSDLMSIDLAFHARMESLYAGDDPAVPATPLRDHGASTIKYSRGACLVVDLTNRCNMMCDPCYMDANQVGYVHELGLDDVRRILEDAAAFTPRRQIAIQFAGGEPTISPIFLDACRMARDLGFFSIQAATNGLRFALEPAFARQAAEAGLRIAYLQFDGVGNEAHSHRKIGNLWDVKQRIIDNLRAAGIDTMLVPTIVNSVNDDQVGPLLDFLVANHERINGIAFQPVSFSGRDDEITDERRLAQRYTTSHLVHAVKVWSNGEIDPLRDWFPLSALAPFSDAVDMARGYESAWGSMKCGCHPNCGAGFVLLVERGTKRAVPLTKFLDLEAVLADMRELSSSGYRGTAWARAQMAASLVRHFDPAKAPDGISLRTLLGLFMETSGADHLGEPLEASTFGWEVKFVAAMWFQDVFNYDFRRTERCVIPYGTQMGEISFCAYNTGVGWRWLVEREHKNASVSAWYRDHGKHRVYANGRPLITPDVPLDRLVRRS